MKRIVFICVLCFLNQLILSAFLFQAAAGQDPGWGTPEMVEKNHAGGSHDPDVASDGNGNALAVWHQFDGMDYHIYSNKYVTGVGWGSGQLIEKDKAGSIYLSGPAYGARVVMNAGGKGAAVWEKGNRANGRISVYANSYDTGSGWGVENGSPICRGDVSGPRVAIGPNGVAIAVWGERTGTWDTICSNTYDGSWGSPKLVVTGVPRYALFPEVGVDSSGNAVAVWAQSGVMHEDIYASINAGGSGWGTPQLIETNDTGGGWYPKVAVDPGGNATVVWEMLGDIWANRYVPGFGWGTANLIETNSAQGAYGQQIAADASGNVIAVWAQRTGAFYSIWANRYVSGVGWGTAEQIETNNLGDAKYPEVSIDGNGNAVVVWNESDGMRGNIWANRYVVGAGWGTAQPIETIDSGDALLPQVAVDLAGNAVVVWEQRDGPDSDIWANRYTVGVGWGVPALVETDRTGDAGHPQVAVDSGGNALAVWEQENGGIVNIWANRYVPGVGWGTDVLIEGDDWGDALSPQIAVDTKGNALVVWHQYDFMQFGSYIIRASRYVVGSGWTTRGVKISSSGDAFNPQVAFDASGNATAVWQQDSIRGIIFAKRYDAVTGWGTALQIEPDNSGDSRNPQVAVDPTGNAVAVWQRTDGIWANRYVAGVGWGTAALIEAITSGAKFPQVAIDATGNAVAVWQQSQGAIDDIWANRYVAGIGWGAPGLIESSNTENAQSPQVAMDASGNAMVVWQQSQGARNDIWANRYAVGVGWGTAGLVETDNIGDASSPQVAVNPDGNVMAVWHQLDGRSNIYGNRYVVGRGWGTPSLAEDNPGDARNPQVALSPSGNATIVWQQSDGLTYRIWGNGYVTSDESSPVADAGPDRSVVAGTLVTFDGSASTDNVGIVNYTWSFFDSSAWTLYGVSPAHTFASVGSFTVVLIVKDAAGNYGMDFVVINVTPPPDTESPIANAGPDLSIDVGTTIVLDGSASTDNIGIVNYSWSFSDAGMKYAYSMMFAYQFNNVGVFTITLSVRDAAGNSGFDTVVITVDPITVDIEHPIADAGPDQLVAAGVLVTFDGSASNDNVGIVNYEWAFIDGSTMTLYGISPMYTFSNVGTFVVTLTVRDAAGNSDSDVVVITVTPPPDTQAPVANAGPDQSILVGSTTVLDGTGSTDDLGIVRYTWTFTYGGATRTLHGQMAAFRFDVIGDYEVTLTVSDSAGNSDNDTATISVTAAPGGGATREEVVPPIVMAAIALLAVVATIFALMFLISKRKKGESSHTDRPEKEEIPPEKKNATQPKEKKSN